MTTLIVSFIVLLGLAGIIAAVLGIVMINREGKILDSASILFSAPESRFSLRTHFHPREWFNARGLQFDSHIGDQVEALWVGWTAGKLPGIGELHALAARRERSRFPIRFASGVAATLLIIGVAGTLVAIHPILNTFTIEISSDGSVQDAAKSAKGLMSLVHDLSTAFRPSIAALVFTILVVMFRGVYVLAANRLAKRLDSVVFSELFAVFRVDTLPEQLEGIQQRFANVAQMIENHDNAFLRSVAVLESIVDKINVASPEIDGALRHLGDGANFLKDATQELAGRTDSVSAQLENSFGKDSTLVKSLESIRDAVQGCQDAGLAMRQQASDLGEKTVFISENLRKATNELSGAVLNVPEMLRAGCKESVSELQGVVRTASEETRKSVVDVGENIGKLDNSVRLAVSSAEEKIASSINSASIESEKRLKEIDSQALRRLDDVSKTQELIVKGIADQRDPKNFEKIEARLQVISESMVSLNPILEHSSKSIEVGGAKIDEMKSMMVEGLNQNAVALGAIQKDCQEIPVSIQALHSKLETIEAENGENAQKGGFFGLFGR